MVEYFSRYGIAFAKPAQPPNDPESNTLNAPGLEGRGEYKIGTR